MTREELKRLENIALLYYVGPDGDIHYVVKKENYLKIKRIYPVRETMIKIDLNDKDNGYNLYIRSMFADEIEANEYSLEIIEDAKRYRELRINELYNGIETEKSIEEWLTELGEE